LYEVVIGCEDWDIQPGGHGAYQKIRMRTLNPPFPAFIAKLSGNFIIMIDYRRVVEKGERFFEQLEFSGVAVSGKHFLANRTNDQGALIPNKRGKLINFALVFLIP
jgi:hypothetical protein